MQNQGVKNVVIRNIIRSINNKDIDTHESLDEQINQCIDLLESARSELHDKLKIIQSCSHSYSEPTYTVQGRIVGCVTIYERTCKLCKNTETYKVIDGESPPEWTEGATQQYYNNNI